MHNTELYLGTTRTHTFISFSTRGLLRNNESQGVLHNKVNPLQLLYAPKRSTFDLSKNADWISKIIFVDTC